MKFDGLELLRTGDRVQHDAFRAVVDEVLARATERAPK